MPLTLAEAEAEALADRLRTIPQTRAVDVFGEAEEEVLVSVDPAAAAGHGVAAAAAVEAEEVLVEAEDRAGGRAFAHDPREQALEAERTRLDALVWSR